MLPEVFPDGVVQNQKLAHQCDGLLTASGAEEWHKGIHLEGIGVQWKGNGMDSDPIAMDWGPTQTL
jgi:hypothetical protein